MGVRTNLLAITPLASEVAAANTAGQDVNGMLNFAAEGVADAIQILNAIADFMPAGSNLTAIQAAITALT
jgi:hypothetical protein